MTKDKPTSIEFGGLELNKGVFRDNTSLFAWDAVQECSQTGCPVHTRCAYPKRGKCGVHIQYLQALNQAITATYKYIDQLILFRIGMQLIPLYSQLLRFKLVELSLESVTYTDEKGKVFIHPVYREIRETLKTIHIMWKNLELAPIMPPDPNGEGLIPGNRITGDPGYNEREEIKSRKGIIR